MKKLTKLLITIIIFATLLTSTVFAEENDYHVRVRIRYPRLFNEQVSLEGYDGISLYYQEDELFTLDNDLNLRIDTYYDKNYYLTDGDKAIEGPYHVILEDELYRSYEKAWQEAQDLSDELGHDFYPYLEDLEEEDYIICGGNFTDKRSAQDLIDDLDRHGYRGQVFKGDSDNIIAYDKVNRPLFMYNKDLPIYFSSYKADEDYEMIKIDTRPYRGKVILNIIEDFRLLTINYVELENYLYGVVPNEIPASWPMEALKAQALAARTYAVYNISPKDVYDMEDNQNSQVYMGYAYEKPSTNRAVDESVGQMIYYEDELIQAFYHSTSGGMTESSGNVWYEDLPYLKGVNDEFSDNSGSPHNEWQTTFYKEDIIRALNLDGNDVNKLHGIQIEELSDNNRVIECIFLTDAGEISYKKERLRLLLGLKSSWFTIENGNSFFFVTEYFPQREEESSPSRGGILDLIIEEEEDKEDKSKYQMDTMTGKYLISGHGIQKLDRQRLAFISSAGVSVIDTNSDQYNFGGRGWGHGIGMSQYGAKQMAEEGYSYNEILQHYYTGVRIR